MTETVLDRIVDMLTRVSRQSSPDQEPPAAILWPDPDRNFAGIASRLRARLPLVTLGPYESENGQGPAIWIRCVLAGTVEYEDGLSGRPLCVYVPGYSREQIRDIGTAPSELQAIADLQFRGTIWLQRNGHEWTAHSLLGAESGLDLKIPRDGATRDALLRALPALLDEPLAELRHRGQLGAQFFNELLAPDPERLLLLWMNDPTGAEATIDTLRWSAFLDTCRTTYGFDPLTDGVVTAASGLGERKGDWAKVWNRFVETPERYPAVPSRLRAAQPQTLMPEPRDSWPIVNEQGEESLEQALAKFGSLTAAEASAQLGKLEAEHKWRRETVWAKLGQAPLAGALVYLLELTDRVQEPLAGSTPAGIAEAYAEAGWKTDRAALKALASVPPGPALEAVGAAVRAVYEPWLDDSARALQKAFAASVPEAVIDAYEPGTCVLFIDGLRFDVAQAVREQLEEEAKCTLEWRFSAIPTVTPTAKPAVSPVAGTFHPGPGLSPSLKEDGAALTIVGLRKALTEGGWQVLAGGDCGDPTGRAWIEGGDIDTQGHNIPAKLPQRLESEAVQIAGVVMDLLGWGWKRVVVVTDHGWLHLPGGLPKVELPIHATEGRKGRCARIPDGATVSQLTLPWRWDPAIRIAVAPGIACYEAGKEYEHGGISPQESVTPHLIVEARGAAAPTGAVIIRTVRWVGMRCRIEVDGAEGAAADIRTKPADPNTSVVAEPKTIEAGKCALVVPDDQLEGQMAAAVILDPDGVLLAQQHTIIGGEEE